MVPASTLLWRIVLPVRLDVPDDLLQFATGVLPSEELALVCLVGILLHIHPSCAEYDGVVLAPVFDLAVHTIEESCSYWYGSISAHNAAVLVYTDDLP